PWPPAPPAPPAPWLTVVPGVAAAVRPKMATLGPPAPPPPSPPRPPTPPSPPSPPALADPDGSLKPRVPPAPAPPRPPQVPPPPAPPAPPSAAAGGALPKRLTGTHVGRRSAGPVRAKVPGVGRVALATGLVRRVAGPARPTETALEAPGVRKQQLSLGPVPTLRLVAAAAPVSPRVAVWASGVDVANHVTGPAGTASATPFIQAGLSVLPIPRGYPVLAGGAGLPGPRLNSHALQSKPRAVDPPEAKGGPSRERGGGRGQREELEAGRG